MLGRCASPVADGQFFHRSGDGNHKGTGRGMLGQRHGRDAGARAHLEPSARGRLKVGQETWQDGIRRLPPHRRAVGYVFQQPVLFGHLDVRENLRFGMRRRATGRHGLAFDMVVELLEDYGYEPDRFSINWVSSAEPDKFVSAVSQSN